MAKSKSEKWLTKEGLLKIEGWARDGLTEEQIAQNMSVSRATLAVWKKKYQDILDTLKRGKEVVDIQVENALLRRALGHTYDEVTKEQGINPKTGQIEMIITKVVTKEVQPDTTAAIFWLKNRKPDIWRDKRDVNVNDQSESTKKLTQILDQLKE